jgi:hypothetical protein
LRGKFRKTSVVHFLLLLLHRNLEVE